MAHCNRRPRVIIRRIIERLYQYRNFIPSNRPSFYRWPLDSQMNTQIQSKQSFFLFLEQSHRITLGVLAIIGNVLFRDSLCE